MFSSPEYAPVGLAFHGQLPPWASVPLLCFSFPLWSLPSLSPVLCVPSRIPIWKSGNTQHWADPFSENEKNFGIISLYRNVFTCFQIHVFFSIPFTLEELSEILIQYIGRNPAWTRPKVPQRQQQCLSGSLLLPQDLCGFFFKPVENTYLMLY